MRAAGIARSSFYPASAGICGGVGRSKRVDRIFTNDPVYGSRRVQVALLREGISIGLSTHPAADEEARGMGGQAEAQHQQ